ncbi:L,D-transpeptidase family protein [Streptomyces pseudogriseolus]|uniref:L,D-transpeptidase family protein n=1 Tax=Streptomyces pseudogriseolus TaxID=36817 RepID=UPI0036590429
MASSTDRPDRAPRAGSGAARRPSAGPVRLRTGVWLRAVVLLVLAALAAFAGCGTGSGTGARDDPAATGGTAREHPSATAPAAGAPGATGTAQGRPATEAPAAIPGLGPRTRAWIPATARQVVVVTGRDRDANRSQAVLYRHTGTGWEAGPAWPARNALRGWTDDHWAGDLRSPIGVYTLTDAGGLLPDPGTRLPYDRSDGFAVSGTGFEGEPLEGSFDYVVAIDYNRVPGTSPLDLTRPLGADRGGGIWLHVDHDGPTQGCVSLSEQHMRDLLRALDPALHPVVVMGDAASLRE